MPREASTLEATKALIRTTRLKVTPSRVCVLALLRAATSPLSHNEILGRLANNARDRATIYRNLIDLTEARLIRRSDIGDHVWRFEAMGEAHEPNLHPHFVCIDCGNVECQPGIALDARRARAPRAVKLGCVEIQIRGRCDACY